MWLVTVGTEKAMTDILTNLRVDLCSFLCCYSA